MVADVLNIHMTQRSLRLVPQVHTLTYKVTYNHIYTRSLSWIVLVNDFGKGKVKTLTISS
jgi:hypothetical protein